VKLNKGSGAKYGVPYMGSKSRIIEKIARFFPNADNFYDLFGGGFSVTHYMITNRKKSFKEFHFNEIRKETVDLIRDAISGKYNYDVFKPEWIDRKTFHELKASSAYVRFLWSFGNNGEDYLFGEDLEAPKKSMHMAVVFDQFDDFMKQAFKIDKWPNHLTITGKRLYLRRLVGQRIQLQRLQQLQQLQQLERLEQLQRLQQLQQLQQLELTSLSYEQVKIKPNSVIYCDIPYKGTEDYSITFSHDKFFDWASTQENPVFISEYNIGDTRFHLLKEFAHWSAFSATVNNEVKECLYGNAAAFKIINDFKQKKAELING